MPAFHKCMPPLNSALRLPHLAFQQTTDRAGLGGRSLRRLWREFQPAVARLGAVGANAEGHNLPIERGRRCRLNCCPERLCVGNYVIRWGDQHEAVTFLASRPLPRRKWRRQCCGLRAQLESLWCNLNGGKLLDHHETEVGAGHNGRRGKAVPDRRARRTGRGSPRPVVSQTALGVTCEKVARERVPEPPQSRTGCMMSFIL